jgi:PKD repeat protein
MFRKIYAPLFIAVTFWACSGSDDVKPTNDAKACFASLTTASQATPIQFNSDCSANAITYLWDFGDGGTSTEADPTYAFSKSGTFTITLTVTADNKTTDTHEAQIKITSVPSKSHFGNITADETWETGYIHYIQSSVYVDDATLTIQPGAIIKFKSGTQLGIGTKDGITKATLIANGTQEKPILFTADAPTPTPGFYRGIYFGAGSSGLNSMIYTTVEYGGQVNYETTSGNINIANTKVSMENNIIRRVAGSGIYTTGSTSFTKFNNNTITEYNPYALSLSPNTVHTVGNGNVLGTSPMVIRGGNFNLTQATWTKREFDYVLEGEIAIGNTSYAEGCKLTIDPGVNLKFKGSSRITVGENKYYGAIRGTLIAKGTATQPILFTTVSASATSGRHNIYFSSGNVTSELKYCTFEYGGGLGYNYSDDEALIIIKHTSAVDVTYCTFKNIRNCVFYVTDTGGFGTLDYNTIDVDNTTDGIIIPANIVHLLGLHNTVTAKREIVINGGLISQSVTWPKQTYPYYVDQGVSVYNDDGNAVWLTLTAGTEFKMGSGASFHIGVQYVYVGSIAEPGGLIAVGTAQNPIKFTSAKSPAAPGDWGSIQFGQTVLAGTKLQYATIEYGGSSTGNIYAYKTTAPVISNCTISNSKTFGILTNQCTVTQSSNVFANNPDGDVIQKNF